MKKAPEKKDQPDNEWPKKITEKGVTVYIYFTPTKKGGREYTGHTLVYTAAGKRKRQGVADFEKACVTAKKIARQLAEGTGHAHTLTPAMVADYIAADRASRELGRSSSLAEIVSDYVAAAKHLPHGTTLRDAATHYAKHIGKQGEKASTPLATVIARFKSAKEAEDLSDYYIKPLHRILDRFAANFKCSIGSIEAEEVRAWITAQKVGKRTRNNLRNSLATLFSFARDEGYLPEDQRTAVERVKAEKIKDTSIGIYTAEELSKILAAAPERLVPAIAVAAFAGIRSAELLRLEWRHVKLAQKHIELPPEVTKTSSRRVVPIQPALAAWLRLPFIKKEGNVTPPYQNLDNLTRGMVAAAVAANVTPKRNGFRHSFGTYRLAVTRNAPQTSLEMGNSVAKLMKNYNKAATPAQGKAWFAVMPEAEDGKVIDYGAAAAVA